MEDRNLTPQQSVELISTMISTTRRRMRLGQGNIFLFWGYFCVAVALIVVAAGYIFHSPNVQWLWMLTILGIPYALVKSRRERAALDVLTYSDRLTASLWKYVLWLAAAAYVIAIVYAVAGHQIWFIMMLYAFFVIGIASSFQGMIIKERSLVAGGAFGVIAGGVLVGALIGGQYSIIAEWNVPLFIITFIVMMIIPGHILNRKAHTEQ